jgi:branched-chain amino acid transport system permease protein
VTTATITQGRAKAISNVAWIGIIAALVILILAPQFIKSVYWINLMNLSMIFGICALGLNFVLGYAGQISLGHAAFWGLGAYTSALLSTRVGLSPWIGLLGAILITAGAGAILGFPTLKLRGHYLAMATIGFGFIIQLILINWTSVTMGSDGIAGIPSFRIGSMVFKAEKDVYYLILAIMIILCLIALRIKTSRIGRAFFSVRENEMAAEALGVDTTGYKILAFCLAGTYAGIAGSLFAHSGSHYISPDTFSFDQSVLFLAMLVLGGSGSIPGAVIGGALLTLLPEWLRFLRDAYMAVNAAAIILIMIFMPTGIAGLVRAARNKWFGGDRQEAARPPSTEISAAMRARVLDGLSKKHAQTGAKDGVVVQIRDLAKHFGGLKAVDGVDIDVRKGAIHALIGPNGSGKTTILNMLSGLYVPTGGKISFKGADITGKAPHVIASHGMGRTFQNIRLFPQLTVLENVMIGDHYRGKSNVFSAIIGTPSQRAEEDQIYNNSMAMLEFVGLSHLASAEAKSLPYGRQRLLELARALVSNPDVLLLDEPAAGLNPTETQELVDLLFDITDHGITIFLVEHDMNLVMGISEDITVLNFGKKIAEGDPDSIGKDPEVITAYLGQEEDNA